VTRAPLPAFLARAIARGWPPPPRRRIEPLTGLADAEWRSLAEVFPGLGGDPGGGAARARRTFAFVAWNELSRRRPRPRWDPAPPPGGPELFLTAHIGSLRLLRYFLRGAGIPTGTIVDETHYGSETHARANRWVDGRFSAAGFPHTFSSREPHRLRAALRRGSLLNAIDRIHPPAPGAPDRSARVPFLGGTLEIELGALRLARLAGVAARPVFISAPRGRITITVGEALSGDVAESARAFGEILARVARESPGDFDGYTHRFAAVPGGLSGR
jgi:hypothetical protein